MNTLKVGTFAHGGLPPAPTNILPPAPIPAPVAPSAALPAARSGVAMTPEQRACIEASLAGEKKLKIVAFAGSGKTTTLCETAKVQKGRGLYLAFNKAIQQDAEKRFPRNVMCRTAHSLAFAAIGRAYKDIKKFTNPSPHEIVRLFGWPAGQKPLRDAWLVRQTLLQFCSSADRQPGAIHVPMSARRIIEQELFHACKTPEELATAVQHSCARLAKHAEELWAAIGDADTPIPMPHDVYLKAWALDRPELKHDFILFDEAQDASPVMLDLVLPQRANLILVGDPHQEIYRWRGAINAMTGIDAPQLPLTQSFRFGAAIADVANKILALKKETRLIRGFSVEDSVGAIDESQPYTILARTNATTLLEAIMRVQNNVKVAIVGGVDEMVNLAYSAYALFKGWRDQVTAPMLMQYQDWAQFEALAGELQDAEMRALVRLVSDYGDKLPVMLNMLTTKLCKDESSAHCIISTAHRAKGREWDQVRLANDFPTVIASDRPALAIEEEVNLLYVASTRARRRLEPNTTLIEIMAR